MTKFNDENEGRRVELIYTGDHYTTLKTGDKGFYKILLEQTPPFENQHLITWDNGSNLILLEGIDKFKFIEKQPGNEDASTVS